MFDNLLGQAQAVSTLESAIASSSLPPAMLFHGPWCSGKTTAALELARVSSCEKGASWTCACNACERHRRLTHPDLLIMGPDHFAQEIGAVLPMIKEDSPKRELYSFIRAIRRLTKRFDAALWAGEESKLGKAVPLLSSLEEILSDLDPGSPAVNPPEAARKAAAEAAKLIPLVPQGIPISQVRAASAWARFSPSGPRKLLVLENADLMLEASRNALLKLLEEPPATLTIVLCAQRRQAIMETILSRLRPLAFHERKPADSAQVLQRIFSIQPSPESLSQGDEVPNAVAAWLESFNPFGRARARSAALSFLSSLRLRLKAEHPLLAGLPEQAEGDLEGVAERSAFPVFCKAILNEFSALMRKAPCGPDALLELERWSRAVTEAAQRSSVYNQAPEALLSWLMRELSLGAGPA